MEVSVMARVGFLGLGIMGFPMAQHLALAGHTVALWSNTAAKAKRLADETGGVFCATPAVVAEHSDFCFLCVGDTAMSREAILGPYGLSQKAQSGYGIADCSTVSPVESIAIAEELKAKGIGFLDAPCTGSRAGAEGGTLTFMVGGDKNVFEKMKPLLEAMGKQLYYCGESGMGLRAKLTQNLILGNLLQAFNEGFVLSTKAGVDPDLMLDIINNSAARSGLISAKAPAVFKRSFTPNFSVKWLAKDLKLAMDEGKQLGVPLTLTPVAHKLFEHAVEAGYGEEDICGSIRVLEDQSNVTVATD
jgi:3-hydroxyisobutyrate dehydrogenase/2-hydroxy-3-oxopropionate reductase